MAGKIQSIFFRSLILLLAATAPKMALALAEPDILQSGKPILESESEKATDPEDEKTIEQMLIDSNITISEWFDSMAEGIDLFIVGKKLTTRENETNATVSNSVYYHEGQGLKNAISTGINMRFPNVEEYWNLKFTTYDETQERGVRKNVQLRESPRPQSYGASVGLFQKLGEVRTSFQPRVNLKDPLDVSHSLTFESLAEVKNFRVNPKLEFFANPTQGAGIFHALNFNFVLTKIYSITLVHEGEYEDKTHRLLVTNGVSLGQFITARSALSYGFFLGSINQPNYHLDSYGLSVTWSHLLYKRILDYSVTPQLNFRRDNNFTGVPGIVVSFNLNF